MRQRLLRLVAGHATLISCGFLLAWVAWIAAAVSSRQPFRVSWVGVLFLIFVCLSLLSAFAKSWQRRAIRESALPVLVKRKLRQQFPQLEAKDADLVERGFRQFFMACARSERRFVAMPSKLVDAYWHAFILDTQRYAAWCDRTLGRFLHHVPTERLGSDAKVNDGLRRAWFFACKEEAINPRAPSRLPLLFALDTKFAIPGGVVYSPRPRPAGDGGGEISYGNDFTDSAYGGDAGDMGGADGGGDGGSGDGGGCGGGGD